MRARAAVLSGCAAALLLAVAVPPARGFVDVALSGDLVDAPRWSSTEAFGRGLGDGTIAVAVNSGFAADIALAVTGSATPEDIATIESAVSAAFQAWESPVLHFSVSFSAAAVRGPALGAELDVFQVQSSDPDFASSGANFGVTYMLWGPSPSRALTNGAILPGQEIYGADILIAVDRLAAAAPSFTPEEQPKVFQRLLMHEIGHAIGLHHPHSGPTINFDSDTNPNNAIPIDPSAPLAGLALSPNLDTLAVMNQLPSDLNALFYISLRNDDRGGRDALYPALGATQAVCQPVPEAGCRTALRSSLKIRDDAANDAKDALKWKWLKGSATAAADFGAPSSTTRYSLCLYAGATPTLIGELALPAGAEWQPKSDTGFKYNAPTRTPHGVRTALLKSGEPDKAKVVLKAGGLDLPDGMLPIGTDPVVAELVRADTMGCWSSSFAVADILSDDAGAFIAKQQ